MALTQKKIATISHLSALLFSQKEIEILMNDNPACTFEEIQQKGRLQGEYEMRKALYSKAKEGDTGAISQWIILKALNK